MLSSIRPAALALAALVTAGAPALAGDPTDTLYPSDPNSYANFGRAVDASSTHTIVGAPGFRDSNNDYIGAVYVFDTATGQQVHKLMASDPAHLDYYGAAVDIDGSLAVVGAWADDDNGEDSGSAYVFDVTTGQQLHKLLPDDGAASAWFGVSVGISDNTIIVGASGSDQVATNAGSAYFFDATTGLQIARWLPGDGEEEDRFGRSVAIDLFKAVAGAPGDDNAGESSGSCYVYDLILMLSQGRVNRTDGAEGDRFGWSVDIADGQIAVSAPYDDDTEDQSGSVYVFDYTGAQLVKMVANDPVRWALLGYSVAIDGNSVVAGAWNGQPNGFAYLFDWVTGEQMDKLQDPTSDRNDRFGYSVGIGGGTAVVGAYYDDDNGNDSGTAFLFNTCPDNLLLTATPNTVQQGDDLYLTTFGGLPNTPNLLFVVAVNGIPHLVPISNSLFNSECKHYFIVTVPGGLAGLDVTFLSIGTSQTGLQMSNQETVQFQ